MFFSLIILTNHKSKIVNQKSSGHLRFDIIIPYFFKNKKPGSAKAAPGKLPQIKSIIFA